jgi:hypothetical protein
MATQMTGARRRSSLSAILVGLALAVAVIVLATQASSIWSTQTGSQVQQAPAHFAPGATMELRKRGHIPNGCRVKFGCTGREDQGSHSFARRG